MLSQKCPLCSGSANFVCPDFGQSKAFNCRNCNEFIIATDAEEKLQTAPQALKDKMSKKAQKTPEDEILVIACPRLEDLGSQPRWELRYEYEKRKD